MNANDLIGYYTYRSLLDRSSPVDDFNQIKFAEAEVFLHVDDDGTVTGTLGFPPEPGAAAKNFMDLNGRVASWSPLRLHFTGRGRAGTAIVDFVYEYDCFETHAWDFADPKQKVVLTGTVRRNQDHGAAKKGVTASFVAVQRDYVHPRDMEGVALIPEAVAMLASRVHRLRHTVWHTLRSDWFARRENSTEFLLTDEDRAYITSLGWGLADPPFTRDRVLDVTNGAGEDFLFMHRRMIAMVRDVYQRRGLTPPQGWKSIPGPIPPHFVYDAVPPNGPGHTTFTYNPSASGGMIPPANKDLLAAFDPNFEFLKSRRFHTGILRNFENWLKSPRLLAQLTLGAYGNILEFTIHNWLHLRWTATPPVDPATGAFLLRDDYDVDEKWDVPSNDNLADFHSSHVNPIFWRLHGWVDDRIEDWFRAHEAAAPESVKRRTLKGVDWFDQGVWVVKDDPFDWPEPHGGHGSGHGDQAEIEVMLKVMTRLREASERPEPDAGPPSPIAVANAAGRHRLSGFARSLVESRVIDPGAIG